MYLRDYNEALHNAEHTYQSVVGTRPHSNYFYKHLEFVDGIGLPEDKEMETMMRRFFQLRRFVEKQPAGMDYVVYGRELWDMYIGSRWRYTMGEEYNRFLGDIVRGHVEAIPVHDLGYPEVDAMWKEFMKTIYPTIRSMSLWSMGDVYNTGYQVLKIAQAGVAQRVSQLLNTYHGGCGLDQEPLGFVVAGNKRVLMTMYWEGLAKIRRALQESGRQKIVVIEDSADNLEYLQQYIKKQQLEDVIELIPLWVTYSREGSEKKPRADYEEMHPGLLRVNRPMDIVEQYGDLMENARVYVDFDGVMIDNATQRIWQAKVKYAALRAAVEGIEKKGGMVELKENPERGRYLDRWLDEQKR